MSRWAASVELGGLRTDAASLAQRAQLFAECGDSERALREAIEEREFAEGRLAFLIMASVSASKHNDGPHAKEEALAREASVDEARKRLAVLKLSERDAEDVCKRERRARLAAAVQAVQSGLAPLMSVSRDVPGLLPEPSVEKRERAAERSEDGRP